MQNPDKQVRGVSMEAYIEALAGEGQLAMTGPGKCHWGRSEMRCLERIPVWSTDPLLSGAAAAALWRLRSPAASYVRATDDEHPANAVLYICQNQEYAMEGLERIARKNLRRALRELTYDFVEPKVLLEKGATAFYETRSRIGLDDGHAEAFHRRFDRHVENPANVTIAAWRGSAMAAFVTLNVVEDWAETTAFASANEFLSLRPNDGLMHFILDYYLKQNKFRQVLCGLSSIQEDEKSNSLDKFKRKAGFEARPVHRALVFHPLLRPMANIATLAALRGCLRLRPTSRTLRKAAGLLATYLGRKPPPTSLADEEIEKEAP